MMYGQSAKRDRPSGHNFEFNSILRSGQCRPYLPGNAQFFRHNVFGKNLVCCYRTFFSNFFQNAKNRCLSFFAATTCFCDELS